MAYYEEVWKRKPSHALLKYKKELEDKIAALLALDPVPAPAAGVYALVEKRARSDDLIIERAALVAKLQRLL